MQAGHRYTIGQTLRWTKKYIILFVVYNTIPALLYYYVGLTWIKIPWEPISVIGIAVAFYLGFKNNSAYDRLWEARKIYGGIVNSSRAFTVMARDFVNNEEAKVKRTEEELSAIRRSLVHRHVAWLRAFTLELRKVQQWERNKPRDFMMRDILGTTYSEEKFEDIRPFMGSDEEHEYVMSKGNRASHILSIQSKKLMEHRLDGTIEHFRHLQLSLEVNKIYDLQGQAERIKNFPFPRQYSSVNYFFVVLFLALLPFAMLDLFSDYNQHTAILYFVPFSVVASWVFWMMEMISEYSENPFQGLHNDVPISSIAQSIERDILQMIDETDVPDAPQPLDHMNVMV